VCRVQVCILKKKRKKEEENCIYIGKRKDKQISMKKILLLLFVFFCFLAPYGVAIRIDQSSNDKPLLFDLSDSVFFNITRTGTNECGGVFSNINGFFFFFFF
jgi:ABC-type microcin C transport system permease subunit YejE